MEKSSFFNAKKYAHFNIGILENSGLILPFYLSELLESCGTHPPDSFEPSPAVKNAFLFNKCLTPR